MKQEGPNVLCVVLDTARRDAFEPYGAEAGSTPTVAQLASAGRALPDVHASASWTVPSHASFLTGELPRALGLGQAPGGRPSGCRPTLEANRERLLPEVLRRNGYATAAVSANVWISKESGFATGFERFDEVITGRQDFMHRTDPVARMRWGLESARASVDDGAAAADHVLARMIDERPERPFFWFVNLIECHSPYLPPRPYDDLPLWQRIKAGADARRHLTLDAIWRACAGGFDIPDEAIARMRHLYARAIRYLDDWLARVLERLERASLLDDTLVLVTSDHGENLGEGGLISHAFSLDQRLIRVPLIAAGPVEIAEMSSLIELPRAIADAIGLDEHPWHERPGVTVAQFDPLTTRDDPRAREVVEHWGLGEEALTRITSPITCAVDGSRKLVRFGDRDLFYDLGADPLELQPNGDAPAHLRAALDDPRVWAKPADAPAARADEGDAEDIERRMRLLGYM
ncbi:MAG: sulfatase-like hydrolase/transferase [Thermoleophilaceae bacterium]